MSMRLSGVSPEVQEHVAIVIESAANYIIENGWRRVTFGTKGDLGACANTAIAIASGIISKPGDFDLSEGTFSLAEVLDDDLAIVAFADYLVRNEMAPFPDSFNARIIWGFNDAHGRTMDEVLTALMACAESLRAGIRAAA